jgi:hypothetical protein
MVYRLIRFGDNLQSSCHADARGRKAPASSS